MVVRGPAIPAGTRITDPVTNVDLAPTILELAEVTPVAPLLDRSVDGRSLAPYTYGRGDPDRAILIESKRPPRLTAAGTFVAPSWVGVRTRRYSYVEHYRAEVPSLEQGFGLPIGSGTLTDIELYDLELDPKQMRSRGLDPAYAATRATLSGAVARLRACAGEDCRLDLTVPGPG
jgi:arylsulfatase A-like enzyme